MFVSSISFYFLKYKLNYEHSPMEVIAEFLLGPIYVFKLCQSKHFVFMKFSMDEELWRTCLISDWIYLSILLWYICYMAIVYSINHSQTNASCRAISSFWSNTTIEIFHKYIKPHLVGLCFEYINIIWQTSTAKDIQLSSFSFILFDCVTSTAFASY